MYECSYVSVCVCVCILFCSSAWLDCYCCFRRSLFVPPLLWQQAAFIMKGKQDGGQQDASSRRQGHQSVRLMLAWLDSPDFASHSTNRFRTYHTLDQRQHQPCSRRRLQPLESLPGQNKSSWRCLKRYLLLTK